MQQGGEGESEEGAGGGLVYAICHPAPAWHGSPWSGGVLKGGEGLVGLERWGSGWRWVVVGGGHCIIGREGGRISETTSFMFRK